MGLRKKKPAGFQIEFLAGGFKGFIRNMPK
jgi:hypothetical protein